MAAAVAHNDWEEVGVLAQTPPTKRRPGTCYKVAEHSVTFYGQGYRAGGGARQQSGPTTADGPGA